MPTTHGWLALLACLTFACGGGSGTSAEKPPAETNDAGPGEPIAERDAGDGRDASSPAGELLEPRLTGSLAPTLGGYIVTLRWPRQPGVRRWEVLQQRPRATEFVKVADVREDLRDPIEWRTSVVIDHSDQPGAFKVRAADGPDSEPYEPLLTPAFGTTAASSFAADIRAVALLSGQRTAVALADATLTLLEADGSTGLTLALDATSPVTALSSFQVVADDLGLRRGEYVIALREDHKIELVRLGAKLESVSLTDLELGSLIDVRATVGAAIRLLIFAQDGTISVGTVTLDATAKLVLNNVESVSVEAEISARPRADYDAPSKRLIFAVPGSAVVRYVALDTATYKLSVDPFPQVEACILMFDFAFSNGNLSQLCDEPAGPTLFFTPVSQPRIRAPLRRQADQILTFARVLPMGTAPNDRSFGANDVLSLSSTGSLMHDVFDRGTLYALPEDALSSGIAPLISTLRYYVVSDRDSMLRVVLARDKQLVVLDASSSFWLSPEV